MSKLLSSSCAFLSVSPVSLVGSPVRNAGHPFIRADHFNPNKYYGRSILPEHSICVRASASSMPESLAETATQAAGSTRAALSSGVRRLFIEVDTAAGDETYTRLNASLPLVRMLLPALSPDDQSRAFVLLPDAGAAALFRRDWAKDMGAPLPDYVRLDGLDSWTGPEDEDTNSAKTSGAPRGVFVVAPRSSEVDDLQTAVDQAGDIPIIVVNPDLVDMGVTGLSLNARRLRERVIDQFETVYYLRVFSWGVILRAYPGRWGLWVDDTNSPGGFRLVEEFDGRPTNDEIDECLETVDGGGPSAPGTGGWASQLSRFIKNYMKG